VLIKNPLESFCDALIREQDNLVKLGLIITTVTSRKSLVAQQKEKPKNPKKKHIHQKNKQNKGCKPSTPAFAPNGDKGEKSKSKKTNKHCKFCGKYGHFESKCFKKIETLEATIKKHNISIVASSPSHVHALSPSSSSFNATSNSSFD
jgi:hypothetical protein